MRKWFVLLCVEILGMVYEKFIRPDVRLCPHGYIGITCELCSRSPR